jgi:hypothetical protein
MGKKKQTKKEEAGKKNKTQGLQELEETRDLI